MRKRQRKKCNGRGVSVMEDTAQEEQNTNTQRCTTNDVNSHTLRRIAFGNEVVGAAELRTGQPEPVWGPSDRCRSGREHAQDHHHIHAGIRSQMTQPKHTRHEAHTGTRAIHKRAHSCCAKVKDTQVVDRPASASCAARVFH
jgi:hypothetical protein